jgi:hypothetical protein
MATINISLPKKQAEFIDQIVKKYAFANRSEFIRSLIRIVIYQPQIIQQAATFPFLPIEERSVKKIIKGFSRTKKYSSSFLKDLEEGLRSSDYFEE